MIQQAPAAPQDCVGRVNEMAGIEAALAGPDREQGGRSRRGSSLIHGIAGVGRTALAAAHRLRARYPDGQLYADLRGVRGRTTADLPENTALPHIVVDPDTCRVTVDGEVVDREPATELRLAQRYFMF